MDRSGHKYEIGQCLQVVSERFVKWGHGPGTIVCVLEYHGDGGYEVEIRGADGATLDWFGAYEADVEPAGIQD